MRTTEELEEALSSCQGFSEQALLILDEVATNVTDWVAVICPDWDMGFATDIVNVGLDVFLETIYSFSRGTELVRVPVRVKIDALSTMAMPQLIFNDLSHIKNSAIYDKAGFNTFAFKEIYIQMWKLAGKVLEYQSKETPKDS